MTIWSHVKRGKQQRSQALGQPLRVAAALPTPDADEELVELRARQRPDRLDGLCGWDSKRPVRRVEHQDFGPDHAPGPAGVKAVIASLRRAFPDFHLAIDDVAVGGDVVWLRMTGTGTNDGPFMGHPPTGRRMRTTVFDALRVDGDRIVEHWGVPDRLGALFQLGLVHPPGRVPA